MNYCLMSYLEQQVPARTRDGKGAVEGERKIVQVRYMTCVLLPPQENW